MAIPFELRIKVVYNFIFLVLQLFTSQWYFALHHWVEYVTLRLIWVKVTYSQLG